jgi:hypothetical protein
MNDLRRQLEESQRAMVAAKLKLANLKRGDNSNAPIGALSQPEAADKLNVSRRTVQRAATLIFVDDDTGLGSYGSHRLAATAS